MKGVANVAIVIGVISLIASIVSKLMMRPVGLIAGGLDARGLLLFANTCLLIAITLILSEKSK